MGEDPVKVVVSGDRSETAAERRVVEVEAPSREEAECDIPIETGNALASSVACFIG